MKNAERTFKNWTVDNVRFELGVVEKKQCDLLEDWINVQPTINEWEKAVIKKLLEKANLFIDAWNEYELQTKFIAPITELVDFDNVKYYFSAFSERRLEATYTHKNINVSLKGKVDWMVAIGRSDPRTPFFFIHEYKRETGSSRDAKGQLLATMMAAHILNQTPPTPTLFDPLPKHDKDMPLYGCYVVGRWWFFVVLHQNTYCVSASYDSMDKQKLYEIIAILKKQKQMIIKRLEAVK